MKRRRLALVMLAACSCHAANMRAQTTSADVPPVVVASKPFGESDLLAEMFAQQLEAQSIAVKRVQGLGRY